MSDLITRAPTCTGPGRPALPLKVLFLSLYAPQPHAWTVLITTHRIWVDEDNAACFQRTSPRIQR